MSIPLDELQWKSPEWIQSFGLRTENVLDYFSQSPFFDKTSNNQVVKMQQQFNQQQRHNDHTIKKVLTTLENEQNKVFIQRRDIWIKYPCFVLLEKELIKLKGIEYILLVVREPDLWIIRKQLREKETVVIPLQDYYIIGANVYQSPTVFKIVSSRILATSYHLTKSLKILNKISKFEPSQGSSFRNQIKIISSHNNTGNTAGNTSVGTASMDSHSSTNYSDIMTQELMDKLMVSSSKSKPVYL